LVQVPRYNPQQNGQRQERDVLDYGVIRKIVDDVVRQDLDPWDGKLMAWCPEDIMGECIDAGAISELDSKDRLAWQAVESILTNVMGDHGFERVPTPVALSILGPLAESPDLDPGALWFRRRERGSMGVNR
jgi:hypothetical protein